MGAWMEDEDSEIYRSARLGGRNPAESLAELHRTVEEKIGAHRRAAEKIQMSDFLNPLKSDEEVLGVK